MPAQDDGHQNEVRLGDEILTDISGWDQIYENPRTTLLGRRGERPPSSSSELPLVQDSLLWSLPGWYLEHDLDEFPCRAGRVVPGEALVAELGPAGEGTANG